MHVIAHDPFISAESPAALRRRARVARRAVRDGRLPDAAPAVDGRHAAPVQRRALRALQARHAPHQHGARRARSTNRRCGAPSRAGSSPAPASTSSKRSRRPIGRSPNCPRSSRRRTSRPRPKRRRNWSAIETAVTVRDFLRDGIVRNAVNFPSVHPDELQRLQPWIRLADRARAPWRRRWARRGSRRSASGTTARSPRAAPRGFWRRAPPPASSGRSCPSGVSIVNARSAARQRGIDIVESRSTRSRHFTSLVSLKLHHQRRRAVGRRHRLRAEQPAPRVGPRRQRRGAARRHDAAHRQRRSAGRDRRGRDDSGPAPA